MLVNKIMFLHALLSLDFLITPTCDFLGVELSMGH